MGLFSGVKKIFSSKLGKTALTALATFYGGPIGGAIAGSVGSLFGSAPTGTSAQSANAEGGFDWGGALSSLGSSALDMYTNKQTRESAYKQAMAGIGATNEASALMAHQANLFSAQQAQTQMDFQERMASTQHQREVTDLRAAGLNPLLSGTGGMGNAAPSGAQGTVTTAPVQNYGNAVNTAFEAMKAMAESQKISATTQFIKGAQTEQSTASAKQLGATTELTREQAQHETQKRYQTQQSTTNAIAELDNIHARLAQIRAETTKAGASTNLSLAQAEKVDQEKRNLMEAFKTLKMNGDISASDFGKYMEMGKRATDVAGLSEIMSVIKSLKLK